MPCYRRVCRSFRARGRALSRFAAAAAALLGAACAIPLARGPDAPTLDHKRVAAKEEPNLLRADDGTYCTVPRRTFMRAAKGESTLCVWSRGAWDQRSAGPRP